MYQPRSLPYGDIYKVPTTAVDNMAKRLYEEQKQKEADQQKEIAGLEDAFSKNVGKIRDADIPEYTQKYNKWKQSKINLLKGKFKNPEDFIAAQLETQRNQADWLQHGKKSELEKQMEDDYAKKVLNDKTGQFQDNAATVLRKRRETPMSGFKKEILIPETNTVVLIDLNDIDGLVKYKGQNTDFTKTFKDAQGIRQVYGGEVTTPSNDGLTTTKTVYKAFNPPSKQFEILVNSRKGANWEKDFLINHDYTDAEANEIVAGYERLKQTPEFQAAYKDIPDIPQTAFASNLGRAMALSVMKNAQLNPPIAETKKPQQDIGAVQAAKNKEWDRRNKITFGQSMAKIAANKAAGLPPEDLGYLSDEVAAEVGQDLEVELGGKRTQRRVIFVDDVDPERLNLIIGKDPSKPMQSGVKAIPIKVPQPDGSVIVKKGYYQDLNTGDWEGDNGQKISRERVKDAYINKYAPTKFKAKTGTKGAEKKQGEADDL